MTAGDLSRPRPGARAALRRVAAFLDGPGRLLALGLVILAFARIFLG